MSTAETDSRHGILWNAQDAVDAYCRQELVSLDDVDEDNDDLYVPLVICNESDSDDLVFACVTKDGDLEDLMRVPKKNKISRSNVFVEHTYYGYAYVFGRLKNTNSVNSLDELDGELQDIIVLGAFRPEFVRGLPEFPYLLLTWRKKPLEQNQDPGSSRTTTFRGTGDDETHETVYTWDPSWTLHVEQRFATQQQQTSCQDSTWLELGTIWNATEALQAWNDGTLVSTEPADDDEDDANDSDSSSSSSDDDDDGGGGGETAQGEKETDHDDNDNDNGSESSEDQDEILRLLLENHSSEALVYAWISKEGKLDPFQVLPPLQQQQQHQRPRDAAEQKYHSCVMVKSFLGECWVFGRPKIPELQVSSSSLSDIVILGAYRPERFSAYWEEGDEHDFPCHVISLFPPPSPEPKIEAADPDPLPLPLLRGTAVKKQGEEKKDGGDKDNEKSQLNYDLDESWSLKVCEVMKMQDLDLLDTTLKYYFRTTFFDWPVVLEPQCFATPEKRQGFLDDIQYALDHLPDHAKKRLKAKPCAIWVNKSFHYGPSRIPYKCQYLCYHGEGLDHMKEYKLHESKYQSVEVYDYDDYFDYNRPLWGIGGVWIHELAHAYHDICIGKGQDNDLIRECYEKAMEEGLYDSVAVHVMDENYEKRRTQNKFTKAYACENPSEYFAELSTAFLGGVGDQANEEYNKWYPFNRAQLKQHDPRAYEMLKKVWKVPLNDDTDADTGIPK